MSTTWTYGQMPVVMADVANQVGLPSDYLPFLEASAWHESGWNPNNVNPNDAGGPSEGLEQLHAPGGQLSGSGLSYSQALNPILNLEVAYSNIEGQYQQHPSNTPAENIGLAENPGDPNYANTLSNLANSQPWLTQLNMNSDVPPAPLPPPGQPTPNPQLSQPFVDSAVSLLNQINGQGGGSTTSAAFQGLSNAQLASYLTGNNTSNTSGGQEYVYSLDTSKLPIAWSICIEIQKYLNYSNYANSVSQPLSDNGGLLGGLDYTLQSTSRSITNGIIQWGFRAGLAIGFGVLGWISVNAILRSVGTKLPNPSIPNPINIVNTVSRASTARSYKKSVSNLSESSQKQHNIQKSKLELENKKQTDTHTTNKAREASNVISSMANAGYSKPTITKRLKELGLQ